MINWIEYDSTSREIESHVNHLVTDGTQVWVAQHAKLIGYDGYAWHDEKGDPCPVYVKITHWSKLNLPEVVSV